MPSFLITSSALHRYGDTIEATLCGVNAVGHPDRRSDVPVRAAISEKTITIDDERAPRSIISCVGENGVGTYLITGSTKALVNRERRIALAQASTFLRQLRDCLMPLRAQSDEPDYVVESLQMLFEWIREERERLTEGASHGSR